MMRHFTNETDDSFLPVVYIDITVSYDSYPSISITLYDVSLEIICAAHTLTYDYDLTVDSPYILYSFLDHVTKSLAVT